MGLARAAKFSCFSVFLFFSFPSLFEFLFFLCFLDDFLSRSSRRHVFETLNPNSLRGVEDFSKCQRDGCGF
jgi:hypothetical protein